MLWENLNGGNYLEDSMAKLWRFVEDPFATLDGLQRLRRNIHLVPI